MCAFCDFSSILSTYNITRLLDEDMKPDEVEDLAQAEEVCRRLMAWDLSDPDSVVDSTGIGGVKAKLAEVLGRNIDEENVDEDEAQAE